MHEVCVPICHRPQSLHLAATAQAVCAILVRGRAHLYKVRRVSKIQSHCLCQTQTRKTQPGLLSITRRKRHLAGMPVRITTLRTFPRSETVGAGVEACRGRALWITTILSSRRKGSHRSRIWACGSSVVRIGAQDAESRVQRHGRSQSVIRDPSVSRSFRGSYSKILGQRSWSMIQQGYTIYVLPTIQHVLLLRLLCLHHDEIRSVS